MHFSNVQASPTNPNQTGLLELNNTNEESKKTKKKAVYDIFNKMTLSDLNIIRKQAECSKIPICKSKTQTSF